MLLVTKLIAGNKNLLSHKNPQKEKENNIEIKTSNIEKQIDVSESLVSLRYFDNNLFEVLKNSKVDIDAQAKQILEDIVKKVKGIWFNKELPVDFMLWQEIWNWLKIDKLDKETFKKYQYFRLKLLTDNNIDYSESAKKSLTDKLEEKYDYVYTRIASMFWVNKNLVRLYCLKDSSNWLPLILGRYSPMLTEPDKSRHSLKSFIYIGGKNIKEMLALETKTESWTYMLDYLRRGIIYPIASLFLYNQVLSYINEIAKMQNIEEVEIPWSTIPSVWDIPPVKANIHSLLKIIMKRLITHWLFLENVTSSIRYNNYAKFNIFLKDFSKYHENVIEYLKWTIKVKPDLIPDLSDVKYSKYYSYNLLLINIIKELIKKEAFTRETNSKLSKKVWNRKEYAKVWQTDNFRVLNQTDEIVANILNKIQDKNVKHFIWSFAWYDIDENTNLSNIDRFFTNYYKILTYIDEQYLKNYKMQLTDLTKDTMLKIRKLWQYKASWVYFPDKHVLSVDINWWNSLVHETWHFIHFKIAEYYDNLKKKDYYDIIWIFNHIEKIPASYKALTMYLSIINNLPQYFRVRKNKYWWNDIAIKTDLITKLALIDEISMIELEENIAELIKYYIDNKDILNSGKKYNYSNYWASSAEIFARLFDRLIWDNLPNIIWSDLSNEIKLNHDISKRDNILYDLDNKVMQTVKALTWKNVLEEFDLFLKQDWLLEK